jgi:phage baseplate assembly protein W
LTGNPSNPINAGSLYKDQIGGGGVFRLSYTTEEQAISNLKMLLLTRMGERLYHPTFGTRLQQLVFEPNTDILVEEVANALESAINFWLPYINIIDIIVDNTDTNGNIQHSIEIKLRFQVNDQGANHEIILIVTGDSVNIIQ